ncbi:hypothetical protein BEV13_06885 [Rickettsiella grylli]|nr:hypothetical protein BEV13_06885 [Rickettsiella grylli]
MTNRGNETSLLQLSLFDWKQSPNGKDSYKISHDILLTPPLFALPAHKTQIIRFALKHPTYNTLQKTYRLHLKEVQQPKQKKLGQTLYFLMDISLPLFVQPQQSVENGIWSIKRLGSHRLKLNLYNDGNVSLFVNQWQLFDKNTPEPITKKHSTFAYVLPRSSHFWIVKVDSHSNYTDIDQTLMEKIKYQHYINFKCVFIVCFIMLFISLECHAEFEKNGSMKSALTQKK